jgi:3-ketoacyl-CoA synthase
VTHALVVSTEILTSDYYSGNERAMLLQNCLFRMGASAAVLSTSPPRARYRLARVVRTHAGRDARAFGCVKQEDDDAGERGIALSKDVMPVAGDTLTTHMVTLGPLVLPASELLAYALSVVARRVLGRKGVKPYIPDFRTAFEHFCIHAGGRAVIDEVQRGLGLSDEQVEPSRMALHRFGNTSSSSVWYELAYLEAKCRVRKGDRVWMIGFGSGFKCNSAVWVSLRPPAPLVSGPWDGCMHRYPVATAQ